MWNSRQFQAECVLLGWKLRKNICPAWVTGAVSLLVEHGGAVGRHHGMGSHAPPIHTHRTVYQHSLHNVRRLHPGIHCPHSTSKN